MASTSRNDIFTTSFSARPPSPSPRIHTTDDALFAPSATNLARSRTTGQSWLHDRRGSRSPPPPLRSDKPRPAASLFPLSPPPTADRPLSLTLADDATPLLRVPSRTSSFFDLPRLAAPSPTPSNLSSAYSTRSNPSLMEELPWDGEEDVELGEGIERLRLRLREEERFFLGEGRFAKVWLAAYRHDREPDISEKRASDSEEEDENGPHTGPWHLAAAKQLSPDPEAQLLGRREAFFLRRLAHPPASCLPVPTYLRQGRRYIVRLLGVMHTDGEDEREREKPPRRSPLPHLASSQMTASPITFTASPTAARTLTAATDFPHARSPSDFFLAPASPSPHQHQHQHRRPRSALSQPSSPSSSPSPPPPHTIPSSPRITLLLSPHPRGTLSHLLQSTPHLLTPQLYTRIAHQLALGLAYAHSLSILHTDLKPSNVLLSSRLTPRLADFGSALLLAPHAPPPADGLGLGTPGYTAPELLRPPGQESFGHAADVFALGVMLGVLLFGREPYAALGRGGRGRGEMMRWARRGEYWAYEEGVRLAEVGAEKEEREDSDLRWGPPREAVEELLRDDNDVEAADEELSATAYISPPPHLPHLTTPPKHPTPPLSPPSSPPISKLRSHASLAPHTSSTASYPDGSPPIYFLGPPRTRAPDALITLIKRMSAPRAEARPSMDEVVSVLGSLRVQYA